MKTIYICSPYRGDVDNNIEKAKRLCRKAAFQGHLVVCPHLTYTSFLDDNIEEERELGIKAGLELLNLADELWVLKGPISSGMAQELERANEIGLPIVEVDLQ